MIYVSLSCFYVIVLIIKLYFMHFLVDTVPITEALVDAVLKDCKNFTKRPRDSFRNKMFHLKRGFKCQKLIEIRAKRAARCIFLIFTYPFVFISAAYYVLTFHQLLLNYEMN